MSSRLRIITFGFFIGYAILILFTFRDYGITWDESVQNIYGKKVLNYYWSFFQNREFLAYKNLYLYGALFEASAALVNQFSSLGEYETRHLMNALVGFLGVLGVYALTKKTTGSAPAGLIAAVFLFLTPRYYGHSFNNPKDVPFAVFYLLGILCMVNSMTYWNQLKTPKKWILLTGLAIGSTVGIRVGGLILIFYLFLFFYAVQRTPDLFRKFL